MNKCLLPVLMVACGLTALAASLEHIALEIEDPAAMAKWWTENLGFKVTLARPSGSMFIEDEAGRVAFELYRPQDGRNAPDYKNMPILQLHFGLFSDDVEADVKRLVAAGATEVAKDEAPALISKKNSTTYRLRSQSSNTDTNGIESSLADSSPF